MHFPYVPPFVNLMQARCVASDRKRKVVRDLAWVTRAVRCAHIESWIGISIHDWQWPQRRHWPAFAKKTCSLRILVRHQLIIFLIFSPFFNSCPLSPPLKRIPSTSCTVPKCRKHFYSIPDISPSLQSHGEKCSRKYIIRYNVKSVPSGQDFLFIFFIYINKHI